MIRTKGEAGSGDIVEAVRHRRLMTRGIHLVQEMDHDELTKVTHHVTQRYTALDVRVFETLGVQRTPQAGAMGIPPDEIHGLVHDVLSDVHRLGRLPVVDFTAGGIATPADAALMMQMGSDGVFVGSGIFKSGDPARRAQAIVEATTHFDDAARVAEVSKDLGEPMVGRSVGELEIRLAERGL